ncbi:hypothetical protein [Paenibacillus spongiae]|uniref:DUF4179 domain-containing protein n=1 Tax=Paenibacillus spongiae TaxID=2909671 RepID=A0ABY5S441_9BACL|nr:hypothetical protein [Paenibacillus spongiae]UVI28439.1 hypothetical protein L1F29_23715 [Paenibacillus spongiae]
MNDSQEWDKLLKQALAAAEEPEEQLNSSIINRYKERNRMKRVTRKRFSIGVLVAVLTLVMSITAVAATQLFSSKQVAEHLGDQVLAKAFESKGAIEINQTVASGDFNFTLHGIVSGAGLSGLNSSAQDINPDRTYAVVSIAKQNGSPMPDTQDPEYGKEPFFVSPFIKGQKPWQVNIMTMNGGYSEMVLDGIMYRLIECDGIEMFADRGVYLAVSSGSSFYSSEAFAYNESTGEVSARTDYKGTSILFDLPLDKAKADPAKAEAYLQELLKEPSEGEAADQAVSDEETAMMKRSEELKKLIPDGKVIPESVKEVTYDDKGNINYDYDGFSIMIAPDQLFAEGQTGLSEFMQVSEDDFTAKALQFSRDDKGVITGRVIVLK